MSFDHEMKGLHDFNYRVLAELKHTRWKLTCLGFKNNKTPTQALIPPEKINCNANIRMHVAVHS